MVKATYEADGKTINPNVLHYYQNFMGIVTENWWWNVYVFSIDWFEVYQPKNSKTN